MFDQLIDISSIKKSEIKSRKLDHHKMTINKNDLEKYLKNGWIKKESKYKTREIVIKEKNHFDHFEDRIWALMVEMKLSLLNGDRNFKIFYDKKISKQIDVFAYDKEDNVAIYFECKSSQTNKTKSFSKEINELVGIKEKIRGKIRNEFGQECKVAFVFATNNFYLSDNDKNRLKSDNIIYFNQDKIEYFELLVKHLGIAAKYQLFSILFQNQKVPGLKNRIPAIRGKFGNGYTFYSFSIEPKTLLKISHILHRVSTGKDSLNSYQRIINKNRLKKIEKFIKNGGYFPNSIIINIDTNRKMKFEKAKNEHHSNLDLGVLELPQKYKSAFIIDGQHRLYGYSNLEQKKGHVIPVVAFENLPENEQSELFVDINKEQKSVPANLLRSIMADFKWGSENPKDAITALKTKIFNELNYKEDSPFYKRIVLSEEKKDEIKCLTLHTLINSGLSKTNFFHSIEKGHINKIGTLMNNNSELTISERYQKSLIKCCEFIDTIFQKIRASLPEQWEAGKTEKGFIAMNNPIAAIIQVSDKLLNFVIEEEKIDTYKFDGKELANKILDYLEPLTDFVKSLTYEEIKRFRNIFGSTAPKKISREFEFAINQRYPEFCPKGLKEWIDSHDGKYNKQCYEIGTFIEKDLIHKKVETNLKNKFGEENWWLQGVPVEVQKGAGIRKIEEQSKKHESNFLTLIEYRKIIQKNWDIMENEFSDPNAKSGKKNKTEWMVSFNNIRKKYSHPQRESCTEEDLNNLKYFKNFLEENS